LFNPPKEDRDEIKHGDVIYREGDKVLHLINDPDNNVYNGDIGYIEGISVITKPRRKEIVSVNFDGNLVDYTRKDLVNIKHAYAISVHKSQGSEFDHVVLIIAKENFYMLYNKLIYTAVSRAKKSLVLLGDPVVFSRGVQNNYAKERKTTLKERLEDTFFHE
jgi:exodeoxyribonuclease V alpha subunit